jgi:UDPglucose 6-dehydrogenase
VDGDSFCLGQKDQKQGQENMRNICVIGVGYVGLVTGTCFADLGHQVTCIDVDDSKMEKLSAGIMPIYEPGLEEVVRRNAQAGRLFFSSSYKDALRDAEFAFIAVGTPQGSGGEADLKYVRAAARSIGETMEHPLIIINKSTVPIGTGDWVADIVRRYQPEPIDFSVVSNPEFLREGSAINDFMAPDRIVLGSLDPEAAAQVAQLYLSLRAPIMITDLRTAEMIKYASNAFLAARISFINEIASICEALGADVKEVAVGMGYDRRIGPDFLDAGIGYGGSCFPKDVQALAHMAAVHGCHPQLLRAVMDINTDQRRRIVHRLRELLGTLDEKTVGVLGLAFKPNTDDMREAPSVELVHLLQSEGARVQVYDPVAMVNANLYLHDVKLCQDAYEVAEGADGLVIVTEWNEFKHLALPRLKKVMRQPFVVDGRNLYDPEQMKALGFTYRGVGRGYENEREG